MPRQIIIAFRAPVDLHKMRNFGEALYHACKNDGWASIALQEVDTATKELRVHVHSARRVQRISAMIEKLLEEQRSDVAPVNSRSTCVEQSSVPDFQPCR